MYLRFYGIGLAGPVRPRLQHRAAVRAARRARLHGRRLAHIPIFFHLRTDGDYGLTADVAEINQIAPVRISALSIWGVPSDVVPRPSAASSDRRLRYGQAAAPAAVENPKPFLTLPTSCAGASLPHLARQRLLAGTRSRPLPVFNTASLAGMTGCNELEFEPTLEARPTTNVADSPSGLHVDLKVPQPEEHRQATAEAHLKDATVTLPKGLTVNPSSAAGLRRLHPGPDRPDQRPGRHPDPHHRRRRPTAPTPPSSARSKSTPRCSKTPCRAPSTSPRPTTTPSNPSSPSTSPSTTPRPAPSSSSPARSKSAPTASSPPRSPKAPRSPSTTSSSTSSAAPAPRCAPRRSAATTKPPPS